MFTDWWPGPLRPGGFGQEDIWYTRRTTKDDDWEEPVNLGASINTTDWDWCGMVSSDGSMMYFESARPSQLGGNDIWQAPIIPIVDFNGDGNIDTDDLLILIDNWGTSESLCDIGPMPWGNRVVDMKYLEVFIKYWEQENLPEITEGIE